MKYALVATTSHVLLVDLEKRKVAPIESHRPEYYGISWFPNDDRLVLGHSGLNNEDLTDLRGYALSEVGWISVGQEDSRRCLSAPHQIYCAPDGRVVCSNTGRNVITVLDPARPNTFQEAGLSESRWDRLSLDQALGDHLNSVFLRDGRVHVIAHRFNRGSRLGTFSYPDLRLISSEPLGALTGLHNLWITASGQRIGCDSNQGNLTDLDTGAPLWRSGRQIYTRGLAACSTHVLVGESIKTSRHLRRNSMSGLWAIDRRTWQTTDHLRLGHYGAVHEVRILDVPDEAHHGAPFAGLSKLLARTDASSWQPCAPESPGTTELIFGQPDWQPDGWAFARGPEACLLLKPNSAKVALEFDLSQPGAGNQAEVGLVLDYQGGGGDDRMTLLNLAPSTGGCANLRGWRAADGKRSKLRGWRMPFGLCINPLPQRGRLSLEILGNKAVVTLDGEVISSTDITELGLTTPVHGLGIRWKNAAVRPETAE